MLRTALCSFVAFVPVLAGAETATPPKNHAPTAAAVAITTDEDTPASAQIAATDPDGDALTYRIAAPPKRGKATLDAGTGVLSYEPSKNLHGSDTLTVAASDGKLRVLIPVSITVTAQNDAPSAPALSLRGSEDITVRGSIMATDPDRDPLSFAVDAAPAHGVATVDERKGAVTFVPEANWAGTDSFSIAIKDASTSTIVSVTVEIRAVNDAPSASPVLVEGDEDAAITGAAAATDVDGDALTWKIAQPPKHGTLALDDAATGRFTFTGARDFHGEDAFVLTVSDGKMLARAPARVTVRPQNDAPELKAGVLRTKEDTPARLLVSARDVDRDALRFSIAKAPEHGTATIDEATGALSYAPAADAHGSDALSVQVSDGNASATADVTVDVAAVNDAPATTDAALSVDEDGSAEGRVDASDKEGDALRFAVQKPPAKGALELDGATGGYRYTPRADVHGSDAFVVAASDGALRATATVTVTIAPQNDAPVARAPKLAIVEDGVATLRASATDKDGDALTWRVLEAPAHVTVDVADAKAGVFSVRPAKDYAGSDALALEVSDGAATARVDVAIEVTPTNDAPFPSPLSLTTSEDAVAEGALSATDVEGDALRFSIARPPAHGRASVIDAATGAVRYEPALNWHGADAFAFEVTDGRATTRGEATVTVSPANDPPEATASTLSTIEDVVGRARVIARDPDGDTLRFEIVAPPTNGTATLDATTGALGYTPNPNWHGSDALTVRVSDDSASATAEVTVTTTPVNDPPSVGSATATVDEDASVEGAIDASDVDGDALSFTVAAPPKRGKISLTKEGRFTYAPAANVSGADAFVVEVSDGKARARSEVAVQIAPKNDAPTARPVALSMNEDAPARGKVVGSDVDDSRLTYAIGERPAKGDVSLDEVTGAFTYTPSANENGADAFTVRVSDGKEEAVAAVTVQIRAAPDPPIAQADTLAVDEDIATEARLPAMDPDGDALTFRITKQPTRGTVMLVDAKEGRVRYTPAPDVSGEDAIGFEASDGARKVAGVLAVKVAPKNDAPVADAAQWVAQEDTALVAAIAMSDKDGDALRLEVVGAPAQGTVVVEDAAAGRVRFTPARDQAAACSFRVVAFDGVARSEPVEVRVEIAAQNDAPVVKHGAVLTLEDVPASGRLEASDVDGDPLVFKIERPSNLGTVTVTNAATGAYSFQPAPNKSGEGAVTFSASDGKALATGVLRLRVTAVDDRPVAMGLSLAGPRLGRLQKTLAGYDPDGGAVTFKIMSQPPFGSLTLLDEKTGAFLFTTDGDFTGSARFSFVVNDGALDSAPAVVQIDVK